MDGTSVLSRVLGFLGVSSSRKHLRNFTHKKGNTQVFSRNEQALLLIIKGRPENGKSWFKIANSALRFESPSFNTRTRQ